MKGFEITTLITKKIKNLETGEEFIFFKKPTTEKFDKEEIIDSGDSEVGFVNLSVTPTKTEPKEWPAEKPEDRAPYSKKELIKSYLTLDIFDNDPKIKNLRDDSYLIDLNNRKADAAIEYLSKGADKTINKLT